MTQIKSNRWIGDMAHPDIRALDVGMLRAFDALMRERSVSRAAGRLFLSQPAVSAALNRLRRVFGDPLFTRTPHGVVPTPRAEQIAPQVQRLLADLAALLDDGQGFDPAASDRIFRIAGSDHASRNVLPELTRRLAAVGSDIRIQWQASAPGTPEERLLRGDLDLAVVARIRPPRELHAQVLVEDRYVYALRTGHPRAGEPLTLDLFCAIPQTILGYGSAVLDERIDELLARSGRRRRAMTTVTGFAQVMDQIEQADHAAVLGSRVARRFGARLQVQPLPSELDLPTYRTLMCWAPRLDTDPGLRWLREAVAEGYADA